MGRPQWLALLVVVVGVGLVVVLRGGGGREEPTGTGSVRTTAPPTATVPAPAPPAPPQLQLPARAAFYYPWFPESWVQQGQDPFTNYVPSRGRYATDVATVRAQIAEMQAAHITVGIGSWFGQGSLTDQHWPALMQAAQGTGFGWAPYYERDGIGDPTPQQIADDLHYFRARYGAGSNLLQAPGGRMVVFVYNADDPGIPKGCDTVSRWAQARQLLREQHGEGVYVDLKVFPGYRSCPDTPGIDGWHEYGPNRAEQDFASAPGAGSYAISPGFWKSGVPYGAELFLARDRARWRRSIAAMQRSGARWQLVATYNEWGEGTAVESASGCRAPAPPGTLCDWSGGGSGSDFLADLRDAPVRP
jgi:hypothetical protein